MPPAANAPRLRRQGTPKDGIRRRSSTTPYLDGVLARSVGLSDGRLEGLNSGVRLISHRSVGLHGPSAPDCPDLSLLRRGHGQDAVAVNVATQTTGAPLRAQTLNTRLARCGSPAGEGCRPSVRVKSLGRSSAGGACKAATSRSCSPVGPAAPDGSSPRRNRSISATVFGLMTTPRQPRLDSSSTAQISDSAEVSPESARSPLVRRRTSTNVKAGRKVGQFCRLKSGPPWSRRPAAKRAVGEWSGRVRLHADLTVLAKLACALSRTRAVPLAA